MSSSRPVRRGLVLGGGGVLGAAWLLGALSALREVHGFEPGSSDVIVGTSAGSVLGALVAAGISIEDMIDHQDGKPVKSGRWRDTPSTMRTPPVAAGPSDRNCSVRGHSR